MINPKDVTPGYWYVLDLNGPRSYEIIEVLENNYVRLIGSSDSMYHKEDNIWFFISPVPDPLGEPEEILADVKKKLNLPNNASSTEVFRAALAVAKKAVQTAKESNV